MLAPDCELRGYLEAVSSNRGGAPVVCPAHRKRITLIPAPLPCSMAVLARLCVDFEPFAEVSGWEMDTRTEGGAGGVFSPY